MNGRTLTGSQTVGPFFAIGLTREDRPDALGNVLVGPDTPGERIRIQGRVLDGNGVPVPDAMLEIWQANARGRYNHPLDTRQELALDPGFTGFGRTGTDDQGRYWFDTVKPGQVPGHDRRPQAPHILVTVFARGLLNHAVTRLYFSDESSNANDPVLARVPPERRGTLLARPDHDRTAYTFDIVLQGPAETVFFNW
jgi:protocatechuate 3,4-dioxygenase alpha subunit